MAILDGDGIDLLRRDHRLFEQLFLQLDHAVSSGDEADQRDLGQRLVRELTVHGSIEEDVLYPAARKVPAAAPLVGDSLAEHNRVKALLAALDGKEPGDDQFVEGFAEVRDLVTSHVADEERELFPMLREALDEHELVTLRSNLAKARAGAPTSPAATNPVAAVADAATSLLDKAKGAIRNLAD